jgi:hypothetical protein
MEPHMANIPIDQFLASSPSPQANVQAQPSIDDFLGGSQQQTAQLQATQPQQSSGILGTLENFGKGAAHGIQSFVNSVSDFVPGGQITKDAPQINGSGFAYGAGNVAGSLVPWIAGGETLDAGRAALEGAPYIGKLAEALGGSGWGATAARQATGNAIGGAVTNPNDRIGGAEDGALSSLAFSGAEGGFNLGSQALNGIRPLNYAKQILGNLGGNANPNSGGFVPLEQNSQDIANAIKNSFENKKATGQSLYQPVFDKVGNSQIYPPGAIKKTIPEQPTSIYLPDNVKQQIEQESANVDNLSNQIVTGKGSNSTPSNSIPSPAYPVVAKMANDYYDLDLKDLSKTFLSSPTFQNAHELQSQLGTSIRKLQMQDAKGNLDTADRNTLQAYQRAQSAIKNDMTGFLNKQDPTLANQYQGASNYWLNEVSPYLQNKNIAQIAKGSVTNPRNIATIFKNPEDNVDKVIGDLSPDIKNKILYSQLGKQSANLTPEKLQGAFGRLDSQGLGSYINPQIEQQFDNLNTKIARRNLAQHITGALGGGFIGHAMGIPMGETLGAALGYGASGAIPRIQQTMIGQNIGSALSKAYPLMKKAVISQYAGGQ